MKVSIQIGLAGLVCTIGSLIAQEPTKKSGASFSISHTFTDLGTHEEKSREIDGVTIVYPVDEEDLINLLLPKIAEFREKRRIQAPLEAKALREGIAAFKIRAQVLNRVRSILGVKTLSDDIDAIYDKALKDIDSLSEQWVQWSGDIGTLHLFNHATVKPYRNGSTQVHFDQLHYLMKQEGEYGITLHPPFIYKGAGIGTFDSRHRTVPPFTFDIFNVATPGNPVKTVATDLNQFLDLVINLQGQFAAGPMVRIVSNYLFETLLLHEIEAQFFSRNPPRTITRGIARFYLFAHLLNSRDEEVIQGNLGRLVYFDFPTKPKTSLKRLAELKKLNLLGEVPPEYETAVSRIIAMALIQLSQTPGNGSPLFRLFTEKGIEMPKGGFNRLTFTDALEKAYPKPSQQLLTAREELVSSLQQTITRKSGGFDKKPPDEPIAHPARVSKKIGDITFSYPPSLEAAVAVIAPEWSDGLRQVSATLKTRFKDSLTTSPPIWLDENDLDSISSYGIPAPRDVANHFSRQVALLANIESIFVQMFKNNEVQVWIREDLDQLMQSGVPVKGFSLAADGKNVSFNLLPSLPANPKPEKWPEDINKTFQSLSFPALPVVADSKGDLNTAPLEEQIAAIREGGALISQIIQAAATMTPEQLLQRPVRRISARQAFFIIVHEVAEAGLVKSTIASSDRRWFCDGLANLIAIRECDRKFGAGIGTHTFESLFPPTTCMPLEGQVDLLAWPSPGKEKPSFLETDKLNIAHYFFATRALLQATKGRSEDFIREWIGKIRETPWNRTNATTVLTAFQQISKEDLSRFLK